MAAGGPGRFPNDILSGQSSSYAQTSSGRGVHNEVPMAATWVFCPGITSHLIFAWPLSQRCPSLLPVSWPWESSLPYGYTLYQTECSN